MKARTAKKRLLIALFVVACYPLVELIFGFHIGAQLDRAELKNRIEPFTLASWFDGSFQASVEGYSNDNIGLFSSMVRIHNQLEYSFFDKIYTGNVLSGKNHILFEKGYLNAQFGHDFAGLNEINRRVAEAKSLQDSLAKRGKFMMVLMSANKNRYFDDCLPYEEEADSVNMDYFVQAFNEHGINYMNCNPWFSAMRDTMEFLLFPPYGIHWSYYGTMLTADSLSNYIEANTGWDLPEMRITQHHYYHGAKYYDNDISQSMNLFFKVQPDSMNYPDIEWVANEGSRPKKKVLIIGDSFSWDLFESSGLVNQCFSEGEFWFYNQTVHKEVGYREKGRNELPILTRHLDLYKSLQKFDAFILLTNEPNLSSFGWSFIKEALNGINDSTSHVIERNNEYLESQCRSVAEWRSELELQAKERGVDLDSMIQIYLHDKNYIPKGL